MSKVASSEVMDYFTADIPFASVFRCWKREWPIFSIAGKAEQVPPNLRIFCTVMRQTNHICKPSAGDKVLSCAISMDGTNEVIEATAVWLLSPWLSPSHEVKYVPERSANPLVT